MTEQTIHKEQKGAGGIIGISTSIGGAQRWILSSHTTATILSNFKRSFRLNQLRSNPKDLKKKKKKEGKNVMQDCYNGKGNFLIGVSSLIKAQELDPLYRCISFMYKPFFLQC